MTTTSKALLLALPLLLVALPASANSIVLPSACVATDCPGSLPIVSGLAIELQQIYASTLFTGITGPINITGVAVRPSPNVSPIVGTANTATSADLTATVTAGTTNVNPDTGCVLPTNVGCTYTSPVTMNGSTTVFNGTTLLTTTNTGTPRPFDYLINFTTPFQYNPTTGQNLVLDLSTGTNAITNANGNVVIEAIGNTNRQSGTGAVIPQFALLGQSTAQSGLVADILYTPVNTGGGGGGGGNVPEPGSVFLLSGGLAGLALLSRRFVRS